MISIAQIRAGRALLDWTQEDLAKVSGISHAAIAQIERGAGNPRETTLKILKQAFEKYDIEFSDDPGVRIRQEPFAVQVWKGHEAMLRVWRDIEATFDDGKGGEVCLSAVDDHLWEKFYPGQIPKIVARRQTLNIRFRGLLAKAEDKGDFPVEFYRLVSSKALRAHSPYYVYADKVVLIKLPDPIRVVLIRNPTLAESFQGQFDYLWEIGEKLK